MTTDMPNTDAPACQAIALMQHINQNQQQALERGEAITVYTKRVPIDVVDFYAEEQPCS